jgi:plasmid stabilization system protein ParE
LDETGRVEKWMREDAMPQGAWSAKRERQYEHIKGGLKRRGDSEHEAEEIAARTVNKERARHGESTAKSKTSTGDISSGRSNPGSAL